MVVLQPFLGQEASDEVKVSHWCPQHFEALLDCGQSLVASPHHRLWIMLPRNCRETCHPCGLISATGIPQFGFTQMDAVSNNWNTSCTLDGLQITYTSSKNAKSFSSSSNFDCHQRPVLTKAEQHRHQWVSLFPTLSLVHVVHLA